MLHEAFETQPIFDGPPAQAAARLCRELQEALRHTKARFDEIPFLVRPMVKAGFKRQAGKSLGDWQSTTTRLGDALDRVLDGSRPSAFVRSTQLRDDLGRLASYFDSVPEQSKKFVSQATYDGLVVQMRALASQVRALAGALAALG